MTPVAGLTVPLAPILPTFSTLVLPAVRSMAVVIELTTAPVPGLRSVLLAWMTPALLMVFRLPPWSRMASDTRLKGAVAVAMAAVGETVLVNTWATMPAFLPILSTGTLELTPSRRPKALPWPMPLTPALIVPAVLLLPLIASDITSRRGTKAKAPIYIAVAVVMPLEVTVWELVKACALIVPVFNKPPTFVTFTLAVVLAPLTVWVTLSTTG